jgi:hypothetical protein
LAPTAALPAGGAPAPPLRRLAAGSSGFKGPERGNVASLIRHRNDYSVAGGGTPAASGNRGGLAALEDLPARDILALRRSGFRSVPIAATVGLSSTGDHAPMVGVSSGIGEGITVMVIFESFEVLVSDSTFSRLLP